MSQTLRVLHVYKTSLPTSTGGVEVFMDALCKDTAALDIENHIFALAEKPAATPISMNGYTLHQAKQDLFIASTGFSISAFSAFKSLAKKVDVIHYHFPNPFADLLHVSCRIKKPSMVTYHSDIVKQKHLLTLYRPLKNYFLNAVDHIVATSPNYVASSETLQRYQNKVSVIPVGINLENYPTVNPEKIAYWKNKLPEHFFLFVGALRYYKGLHFALDAIKNTSLQLVILGKDGVESALKQQAKENQMDNAYFLGALSNEDKVALLHLCDGFIFPSHLRSEAFGLALLEAAAYGKPLISCEIGTGTTYINIDRETGLVVPPESPDALRNAMQYLLDHPDEAAQFGKQAKQRAESLFTAQTQAKAYAAIYRQLSGLAF